MNISLLNNPRGNNFRQLKAFQKLITDFNVTTFLSSGSIENEKLAAAIKTTFPNAAFAFPDAALNKTELNRWLVDNADVVIAVPMLVFEYEDSPLMKTVNYAIARTKEVYLLSPRGNIYQVWNSKD